MSDQLDRIETMLLRQEQLLRSIGRIIYKGAKVTGRDFDELRRALKEMRVSDLDS